MWGLAITTMSKWIRVLAVVIAAVAVVILAYAVLTPQTDTEDTDHMGMWNGRIAYSSGNVGLIAVSIAVIVVALMVLLLWEEYEPLPPTMEPPKVARTEERKLEAPEETSGASPEGPPLVRETRDEAAERDYLVLRLLTGDERLMFKAIMDSGGEALQKDLILKTRMSNAKVSRLLDKLAQKGVITKERYGSTNKVKIKREGM